jgi:homoserine O-acetyltransferase
MSGLIPHTILNYTTLGGVQYKKLNTSYQVFGKELNAAPVVIVNHALTGNSTVTNHPTAWWPNIVGEHKVIDTTKYTVLAIDVLGNGFNGDLIENYKDFTARDMAQLFLDVIKYLEIRKVYAVIGGSIGGGIAWEMAILEPQLIEYLIPVASDWKASDWIIGHNYIQDSILSNSKEPLQDARKLAMLLYRTPESFKQKFKRTKNESNEQYKVELWLQYHGEALEKRFQLLAYQMMNHLLTTVDITKGRGELLDVVKPLKSKVIQIGVDSDLFFIAAENKETKTVLDEANINNEYHEIKSIHGHDAFLIEHDQLTHILKPIFGTML